MTNRSYIGINHDLRCLDGKYIQMPVWSSGQPDTGIWGKLALPNPYDNSSVGDTAQLYPHGTKFVDGDRTFFYGKCDSVYLGNRDSLGMFNLNETGGSGAYGALTWGATAGVRGDTKVGILASGLKNTTPARDDFAGGWLFPGVNPNGSYRVLASSESGETTSGEVDLTIDYGLIEAVAAGSVCYQLDFSEWTKLSQQYAGGVDWATCPGVTTIDPIAGTWQWVQSWGPCYVIQYNLEIGATAHLHQCVFWIDGSLGLSSAMADRQIAGYMLNAAGTSHTASSLVRLQVNN